MVIDCLKNAEAYYGMGMRIKAALEYLEKTNFSELEAGKYEIDGAFIYAYVQQYETKPFEESSWEAHRKYIDIQYVFSGCEMMGYANIDGMKTARDYDESGDYLLLEGEGSFIKVSAGSFAIFSPADAHMPGLAVNNSPEKIKKIVVKVAVG